MPTLPSVRRSYSWILSAPLLLLAPSAAAQTLMDNSSACIPPNTTDKVIIAVADIVIFAIASFLFVPLVERRFINQDRNPTFGRHLGISMSLLIAMLGMFGLYYGITGCVSASLWWWVGLMATVFVIHAIYTFVVVRSE